MLIIQIILTLFLIFALSRVALQFRRGQIKPISFIFWAGIFTSAVVGVLLPEETTRLANVLGIGRGVDLFIYASIAALFYLIFRAYVMMEDLRHEITQLVRQMAIEGVKKRKQ